MNPNDLMQALISNRWYDKIGPPTGIDPHTGMPNNLNKFPDFSGVPPGAGWQPNSPTPSPNVEFAKPWKDLSPIDKFIMKFLSEPKTDYSGVDTTTRDPTNPLPQPLNPRLQFPNLAR